MGRTIVIPRAVLEATRNCLCLFFTCTTIGLAIVLPFAYFHDPTPGLPPVPPSVPGLFLGSLDEEYCFTLECQFCAMIHDWTKCDRCGGCSPHNWYCDDWGIFPSSRITGDLCCRHHTDDHTIIDINTDCKGQKTFSNKNCRSINGTCNACNANGMCHS
eukprot:538890-Prymnesium_polylepis.1